MAGRAVTDKPAAIHRPLTDPERHLLDEVLVWKIRHNIAEQGVAVDQESTVNALDDLNIKHGMHRQYDAHHVHVTIGGKSNQVILRVTREWLSFHASHDEPITDDELRRAMSKGDIE
jgi:hypothetical protein